MRRLTDAPLGVEVSVEAPGPVALFSLGLGLSDTSDGLPLLRLLGRLAARHLEGVDELRAVKIFL